MQERRSIVRLWQTGTSQVLVTLIRIEGSSYRRPGARLLLASGGKYAGTISGGCLETEITRKAVWMTRNGPLVERYSTLFDDTADLPYGLGCGGTVDLLLEPTGTPEAEALLQALQASLAAEESTVLTWLPTPGHSLRRAIFSQSGELLFASVTLTPSELASPHLHVHRERLEAPQRLILIGAGDDAKPVVTFASQLGWDVIVADSRTHLARLERFPEARSVTTPADLAITPADAVVIMTHSYEQDRAALASVLQTAPRYLGILGARHRTSLLVAEAAVMIGSTIEACCDRIHAPIGLDLGGDGPEAIALAIVSEVQASIQGKLPASRRLTAEDVAAQLERGGATRYLQTHCALDAAS